MSDFAKMKTVEAIVFSCFEMGRKFGRIAHMRHIVFYQLAPNEQTPFRTLMKEALPNTVRRILYKFDIVVPVMASGLLLYVWANAEHKRLQRKNPADYENEE